MVLALCDRGFHGCRGTIHNPATVTPNLLRGRPAPDLWRAWDALGLTLEGSSLVGFWDRFPAVRVLDANGSTSNTVFASTYVRNYHSSNMSDLGGVIAVASWDNQNSQNVTLQLDWSRFDFLSPANATIQAPNITGFQTAFSISTTTSVCLQSLCCFPSLVE